MAASGLVLVGFVAGHLAGNLQIFSPPDHINGYGGFLHSLGPVLWVVRLFLLACVGIHIWAAVMLTMENHAARGAENYASTHWINATLASRTMRLSGLVVLAFLAYHLAQFTLGVAQADSYKTHFNYTMTGDFHVLGIPVVAKGEVVPDVYSMVFLGFSNPVVSIFYIVAVGLLSLHLLHGVDSMFQTFGWRNQRWAGCLHRVVALCCLLYFIGNLAIPGAILTGLVRPAAGTAAALKLAPAQP